MTASRVRTFDVHEDDRGVLLAVEFPEVGFPVRRVFVVQGSEAGLERGNHPVPCNEEVVLLCGSARFEMTCEGRTVERFVLDRPGQRATLRPGEHVRYHLGDAQSRIMVLAEDAYAGGPG